MNLDITKYTQKNGVPILDEGCTIYYEDGQGEMQPHYVDKAFLTRIAVNMNAREQKTGDLSPLVLGKHTDKNANPQDQPPVVGFLHRWRVAPWKNGKEALYADYLINNHDVESVKRYPRRSAEVWINRAEIDPVSLLGATTPERDLGLALLQRQPDLKATCSREDETMEPNTAAVSGAAAAETGENKGIEKILEMLTQMMGLLQGGQGAAQPGDPAAGGEPSDQEIEELLKSMGAGGGEQAAPPEAPRAEEPVAKESSAPPGGTNTEIAQLRRSHDEMFERVIRGERKEELAKLSRDGHTFDVDDELNYVMTLPNAARSGYVARLAKNTKGTAPIGGKHPALDNAVTGGKGGPMTREDSLRVAKLARDESIPFVKAAEKLNIPL